jgi:hypothetical protein
MQRAEPLPEPAVMRQAEAQAAAVRRYTEVRYGAKSWRCERRVAARTEATQRGSTSATS